MTWQVLPMPMLSKLSDMSAEQHTSDSTPSQFQLFLLALSFLTRIPVKLNFAVSSQALNQASRYFALVGVILGVVLALSFLLLSWSFPAAISVALVMAFSLIITGAFHEDGLADSMDALGGGWTKDRILEIMKDSRIGTFGTVALILILSFKFAASWTIAQKSAHSFAITLIFAHTASRYLTSSLVDFMQYSGAGPGSKSKPMASTPLPALYRLPGLLALLISTIPFYDTPLLLLGFFPALLVCIYWSSFIKKWIEGYTGDTLGALQQLTEVIIYLTAAMSWI